MFRYAKPFGQALRPEPANTKYRRPARNLWLLHGRGLHPQTPGRASPPRYGLDGQQRHPSQSADQGEKASEARRPKAGGLFGCLGKF